MAHECDGRAERLIDIARLSLSYGDCTRLTRALRPPTYSKP